MIKLFLLVGRHSALGGSAQPEAFLGVSKNYSGPPPVADRSVKRRMDFNHIVPASR